MENKVILGFIAIVFVQLFAPGSSSDPCYLNSCVFGNCQPVGDYFYKCNCFSGYTGRFCESRIVLPVYGIVLIVFGCLSLVGGLIAWCIIRCRKNPSMRGQILQQPTTYPQVVTATNPVGAYPSQPQPGYNPPPYTVNPTH